MATMTPDQHARISCLFDNFIRIADANLSAMVDLDAHVGDVRLKVRVTSGSVYSVERVARTVTWS